MINYEVFRGYGGFGALGHSVYHRELSPRLVKGSWDAKIQHIATSGTHTAAITESGLMVISSVFPLVCLIYIVLFGSSIASCLLGLRAYFSLIALLVGSKVMAWGWFKIVQKHTERVE